MWWSEFIKVLCIQNWYSMIGAKEMNANKILYSVDRTFDVTETLPLTDGSQRQIISLDKESIPLRTNLLIISLTASGSKILHT